MSPWYSAVRLREPIMLERRGWRTFITADTDGVLIELVESGYVNIYDADDLTESVPLTTFGPTLVLQLFPFKGPC